MTECALRRGLVLAHAVLGAERLADAMGATATEVAALGHAASAALLHEAARDQRVRAMYWRAQAAALAR